jgi:hypothetical protein
MFFSPLARLAADQGRVSRRIPAHGLGSLELATVLCRGRQALVGVRGVEVVGDAGVFLRYWAQVRAVSKAVLVGQGGDVFGARRGPLFRKGGLGKRLFNVAHRGGSGA